MNCLSVKSTHSFGDDPLKYRFQRVLPLAKIEQPRSPAVAGFPLRSNKPAAGNALAVAVHPPPAPPTRGGELNVELLREPVNLYQGLYGMEMRCGARVP